MGFAVFPRKSRRPLAINTGVNSDARRWERICEKIRVGAMDPEGVHRPLVDQLGALFAQLFHWMGDCRLPINIGPSMAPQLFAGWSTLPELRIATRKWALGSDDVALKEFFEVVSRNVTRARVRLSSEKSRIQVGADDLPRHVDGNVIAELSGDELIPQASEDTLPTQISFPILDTTWKTFGNPTTPKRDPQSAPPTEPDPRVARTEGTSSAKEDLAFTLRHAMGFSASQLITVSRERLTRAGHVPTRGWQTYSALYPNGNPAEIAHGPVLVSKNFRNLDVRHGWALGEAMDPLPLFSKPLRLGMLTRGTSVPRMRMP